MIMLTTAGAPADGARDAGARPPVRARANGDRLELRQPRSSGPGTTTCASIRSRRSRSAASPPRSTTGTSTARSASAASRRRPRTVRATRPPAGGRRTARSGCGGCLRPRHPAAGAGRGGDRGRRRLSRRGSAPVSGRCTWRLASGASCAGSRRTDGGARRRTQDGTAPVETRRRGRATATPRSRAPRAEAAGDEHERGRVAGHGGLERGVRRARRAASAGDLGRGGQRAGERPLDGVAGHDDDDRPAGLLVEGQQVDAGHGLAREQAQGRGPSRRRTPPRRRDEAEQLVAVGRGLGHQASCSGATGYPTSRRCAATGSFLKAIRETCIGRGGRGT